MEQTLSIKDNIDHILSGCATILPEGFQIMLYKDPSSWQEAVKAYGSKAVCNTVAEWLSESYRRTFGAAFLFSDACLSFEFQYHLNAYLCTQGLRHLRHITTFAIPKKLLERACRSVEIDTNDIWKWSQRLMFRYFFGIRKELKCTERDPYCRRLFGTVRRIPFLTKPRSKV